MKRFIASVLTVVMLLSMLLIPGTDLQAAEKKNDKSRAIYVVFDNSASMYGPGNMAWSQATYAMEVFAAMMNYESGDVMKVFPMHEITTKGEQGKVKSMVIESQSDVAKIHNMYTPVPMGTPYGQVHTAAKELTSLLQSGAKDEGWLVVLTDGEFDNVNIDDAREDMRKKAGAAENLFVQFLAIGESVATLPKGDETVGFYSQKAGTSAEVVNELAVICNRIFKRNEYKNFKLEEAMEFDIPLSKVIVFAQGKDVKINGLKKADGANVNLQDRIKVSYSATDGSGLTKYVTETPKKDTSLKGEVAIFSGVDSIEAGKYFLDVSGADSIHVYYEPDVEFGVRLLDGENVVEGNAISNGSYQLQVGFINNQTGKFIEKSNLLGEPKFTILVNGENKKMESGKLTSKIDIEAEGETLDIQAGVTYLEDYMDSAKLSFRICTLDIIVEGPEEIPVKSLEDEKNILTVKVTNNGVPLTEEQWQNATLSMKCLNEDEEDFRVVSELTKGTEVSTWKIAFKYFEEDLFKTETGEAKIPLQLSVEMDGYTYEVSETHEVNIDNNKNIVDYVKRYWKEYLLALILFIIFLGYIPPFKKYFSRRIKKRPTIDCTAERTGIHDMMVKGTFEIDRITTLIPYMAETGRLTFSPHPKKKTAKLRATGGNGMVILNTNAYAGKDEVTFNGMSIPENYKGNYSISASTIINVLTPEFTYECIPNVQKSADGSIKRTKKRK